MKRKIISCAAAGILSLTMSLSAAAAGFSDVTSAYDWAKDAIGALSEAGIIQGYPEGTFKPGNNITKEEAVALFARAMGADYDENESIVTVAYENASSSLAKYDTYALEEAAYLMYKNVMTEDDLATYLSSANKSKTLKRYEAATLIAKCLGGDVWLKTNPEIVLSFTDKDDIPSSALGYVYYASELGIINGMGDNKFAPTGDVTRAQIATMIKRIFDLMDFKYMKGTISAVDSNLNSLSIKYESGDTDSFNITKSVAVMLDGQKSQLSLLDIGLEAVVTFSDGNLYSIDAVSLVSEETVTGVFRGSSTTGTTKSIKIAPLDNSGSAVSYELSDSLVVKYNGGTGTISDFSLGNQVTATVKYGKVTMLEGKPKSEAISGTLVKSIDVSDAVYLTVTTNSNEELVYPVDSNATVKRNGTTCTFAEIAIGDMANLTVDYGKITEINATGSSKSLSGAIEEISISSSASTITIKSDSASKVYTVARDAEISLDGGEATIYDLRIGYTLSFKTASNTITKIEATSTSSSLLLSGRITLVNSSYGMVKIEYTDASGATVEKQIFIKSTAKVVDSNDSKVKSIANLNVGMNIAVTGTETLGIYEATTVMVLSSN